MYCDNYYSKFNDIRLGLFILNITQLVDKLKKKIREKIDPYLNGIQRMAILVRRKELQTRK